MSLTNIQRDAIWTKPETAALVTWSAAVAVSTATYLTSGPAGVNRHIGKVTANYAPVLMVADSWRGVGVYMNPPIEEPHPFRIKANCSSIEGDHRYYLGIGYPTIPGGS